MITTAYQYFHCFNKTTFRRHVDGCAVIQLQLRIDVGQGAELEQGLQHTCVQSSGRTQRTSRPAMCLTGFQVLFGHFSPFLVLWVPCGAADTKRSSTSHDGYLGPIWCLISCSAI